MVFATTVFAVEAALAPLVAEVELATFQENPVLVVGVGVLDDVVVPDVLEAGVVLVVGVVVVDELLGEAVGVEVEAVG